MVKKLCVVGLAALVFISVFILMPKKEETREYESASGFKVSLPQNAEITEEENGLKAVWRKLDLRISVMYVLDYSDDDVRAALPTEQLNLESGAFNANYGNYAFVTRLVSYLLEGSEENYSAAGISKTQIGKNNALAYYTQFTSEDGGKCGYLYETVQSARCYIIVVYINDSYSNIFDYDEEVKAIAESLEFAQ